MTDTTSSHSVISATHRSVGSMSSQLGAPAQPVEREEDESRRSWRLSYHLSLWLLLWICKRHGCSVTVPSQREKSLFVEHRLFAIEVRQDFVYSLVSAIISTDPEMIVGEGYMNGSWAVKKGSLETVLAFFWDIVSEKPLLPTVRKMLNATRFKGWQANNPSKSRANIAAHYDTDNRHNSLFGHMLGEEPCYSAALFDHEDQSLAVAQRNKVNSIVQKLNVKAGYTVLDIGSGWGVLARELSSKGCAVTGITLSQEQLDWCNSRKRTGSAGAEEYLLQDYREFFDVNTKKFDRITCIEVLDHIGLAQFEIFFKLVKENLKDDGQFFLQLILRPNEGQTSGWIHKYIYPGGYIASLKEVERSYEAAGFRSTYVEPLSGFHYAQTLKGWRAQLEKNWPVVARSSDFDLEFYRKWMFFFGYSITAFETAGFSNCHLMLVGNESSR